MVEGIRVPCLRCKGERSYERTWKEGHFVCHAYHMSPNAPGCPISEHYCNPCDMCNGFGVLIATELKKIEATEMISRDFELPRDR